MTPKIKEHPIYKIMIGEFNRIFDRKILHFLMIVLPIFLFLFFALVYKNSTVTEIPVVILDQDNSEISRTIIRAVGSTRSMKIVQYVHSVDEIKEEMLKGNIHGAFVIPVNCEADIKSGKPATLSIYKNTSNLIIGNMILKDGMTIAKTISAGIQLKKLRSRGMSSEQAMNIVNPIRVETQALFNPGYNYEDYLIPGLLPVMLQMIIMMVASLIISPMFSEGTLPELFHKAENKILNIIIGKSIPHLLINSATSLGIIGIIYPLFEIPVQGSILFMIFSIIYFVIASFFFGFLFSCVFKSSSLATQAVIFINTPAFLFSGLTFPLWAMPGIHLYISEIYPSTSFLNIFFKINQFGAPIHYANLELIKLTMFISGSIIISFFILKHYQNRIRIINLTTIGSSGK